MSGWIIMRVVSQEGIIMFSRLDYCGAPLTRVDANANVTDTCVSASPRVRLTTVPGSTEHEPESKPDSFSASGHIAVATRVHIALTTALSFETVLLTDTWWVSGTAALAVMPLVASVPPIPRAIA